MDIKFNEKQVVYFLPDISEKIQSWLTELGYNKKDILKFNYCGGKIDEIHIKENKIYYDIQTYSLYGDEEKVEKYIPQEHVASSKEEISELAKKLFINYLDKLIEENKKIIIQIENYKEIIKND